jgi:hypothetical protein
MFVLSIAELTSSWVMITIRDDDYPSFNHIIIIFSCTETAGYFLGVLIYFFMRVEIIR